ncbi:hypothetical protein BOO86_25745 [Mycobacterium sp. CBMA 234]|uniref:DUF2510 domain-containing protein n=1 Tax=Mycolicibacterium sp. CBMA 234 TaxID=1918495 RepID=UPI0012DFDDF8|nr:DUF2510 domain-containing protein [Mycolicibacterium sp. CBMA 234]MUL67901.1 hypothetical protein [Mycolicibacterium sp. CBMA 234]
MTTFLHYTATVRDVFFDGSPGQPVDALTQLLRQSGTTVGRVPLDLVDTAWHELADATSGFMSMNLTDVVAAGWAKYDPLTKAARSTHDDSDATELVALVTHRIESSQNPSIVVYLDGTRLATIEMELEIVLTISGLIAAVKQSRLTEVRAGSCAVSGSLSVQGIEVMKRQCKFNLQGAFRLRDGMSLDDASPNNNCEPVFVRMSEVRTASRRRRSDPTGRYESRWWDGSRWARHVAATTGH